MRYSCYLSPASNAVTVKKRIYTPKFCLTCLQTFAVLSKYFKSKLRCSRRTANLSIRCTWMDEVHERLLQTRQIWEGNPSSKGKSNRSDWIYEHRHSLVEHRICMLINLGSTCPTRCWTCEQPTEKSHESILDSPRVEQMHRFIWWLPSTVLATQTHSDRSYFDSSIDMNKRWPLYCT